MNDNKHWRSYEYFYLAIANTINAFYTSSEGSLGDVSKDRANPLFLVVKVSDGLVGHLAVEVRILQRVTCRVGSKKRVKKR